MMRIKAPKDFYAGLMFLVLGLSFLVVALNYTMGTASGILLKGIYRRVMAYARQTLMILVVQGRRHDGNAGFRERRVSRIAVP
jgi:hypothetical protein